MFESAEPINLGSRLLIHDSDGHRVFLDPEELHMTVHMTETHVWEPHVREIIAWSMKTGGGYIDVGANVGFHTIYAAGLAGEFGKIICAEPNSRVFRILKDNLDINGFLGRSSLYQMAVSNYCGTGTMKLYEGHSGGSGLGITAEFGRQYTEEEVEIDTLDSIIKKSNVSPGQIDVLKIDVEGFELSVLEGGTGILENPGLSG